MARSFTRLRGRRRRFDQDRPVKVLGRGAVVLGMLAVLGWLSITLYDGVPGRDYEVVDAIVPQTGNLIPHDPVRLGGVRVGQVRSIGTAPGGDGRLTLQLEPGTDLKADTGIRLRANGLLGARYVELVAGRSADKLPAGTPIRGRADTLTYGATDALDVFDKETRGALRPLVGELGVGLAGQGRNVNDLLRHGGEYIGPTSDLFATLRDRTDAVHALLPSLRAGLVPLDDNRVDLTTLFGVTATAVQPFVSERDATRETLVEAPGALEAANSGAAAGRPLLAAARRLSAEVRTVLPAAPGGLRATTALLIEAKTPLQRAKPLLAEVRPTVPAALGLTKQLSPVLTPATSLLGDLTPMVTKVGPYGCDIENFGAVFRSMTGLGSAGPGGPAGPAMQFRLEAIATNPTETLGLKGDGNALIKDGYPTPCKYGPKEYPIIQRPAILTGKG